MTSSSAPVGASESEASEQHADAWPVSCELRPSQPAIAICCSCGAFIGKDSRVVNDEGLAECRRCHLETDGAGVAFESDQGNPITRFAVTVRSVIVTPTEFVASLDPRGKLGMALIFGTICIILGQLASLFWQRILEPVEYAAFLEAIAAEWESTASQVEMTVLMSLPFEALVRMALCGLLLQLGALLSGAKDILRFRDYMRIFAYASAAYLLQLIPLYVGGILALVWVMVVCSRALRIHHRLSNGQALIAIAPLALGIGLLSLWGG